MALILDVRADTKKAERQIAKATKSSSAQIKKLERSSVSASSRMTTGFSKLSQVVGPLGVGVAIGGTISLMKSAVIAASNLNESVNAVNVTFGRGSKQILDFGKTAATQIGLANSEFNQLSTVTGALLKTTGKPMREVSKLTIDVGKRAADMASVFNTSVKDALFAFNAGLRGEAEPLRRFAIDVTENTLKQEALSQGITTSVTKMTQQQKTLLRLQSIMRQSEGTAGDFQRTSGELANSTRILSAEWENLSAELGSVFVPAATSAVKELRALTQGTRTFLDLNSESRIRAIASGFAAFAGIPGLANKLMNDATAAQVLADNLKKANEAVDETHPDFVGPLLPPEKTAESVAALQTAIGVLDRIANRSLGIQQVQAASRKALRGQLETQQLQTVEAANFAAEMARIQVEDDVLNAKLLETQQKMMLIQSLSQDLAGAFFDAATGAGDLLDSVKQIAKELAKKAFISFISSLIPGGGLLGGVFGGFFQHGGRPPVGRASIVGERGPEVFIPDRPGRIVPNDQVTNNTGGNITINVTAQQFDESFVKFRLFPIMRQAQKQGFSFG